jgi:signal transduction histidine kinase
MSKSIFMKILATYIAVMFTTLAIVGGLQMIMVKAYLMDSKEKELLVRGKDLAEIIKPMLSSGQDPREIIFMLNRADRILGTEIWVVDHTGKVLVAAADHLYCEGNQLNPKDMQMLNSGKVSISRGQSQFFQEAVIRAAVPMMDESKFIGAVILYTPVAGINATVSKMKELHVGTAAVGLIISIVLGFIISRYITKPLIEISSATNRIAHGNFQDRVRVTSQDELGRLAESFNDMTQKLGEYEDLRRSFVANVSHELRSPLTSIQGFLNALVEGKPKDEAERARYLAILQTESNRLGRLVNDLLEISRFDNDSVPLNFEPFPLEIVIKRALATLKPQAEAKHIVVKIAIPAGLSSCFGDEDRIEQVFHNLLENAIRYTPENEKILIAASLQGDRVLVEVADKGPGISPEHLTHIWERFYRADQDRSRAKGGTGLGLAIVKEIVEKHGGEVSIESKMGIGTTFGFTIPMEKNS